MTSTRNDAARPRVAMLPKAIRFMVTVGLSVVLGPLIGGLGFFFASAAIEIGQSQFSNADAGGTLLLFLTGAYVVGGVIALLAAQIVAIAALWRSPSLPVILVATVAANVIRVPRTIPISVTSAPAEFRIELG
jgi:hypothetical protein